ncbi:uncharacterized protein LOC117783890 [Drosophila innubila]|uniref:uncharacterized protein LOC117783890 n=1 Tax=Drosophila innubila TaxID=198719 RepID=UPI00148B7CD4|nr:uncharacterized protein LOC117783890 [Drosophila innubila]
MSRFMSCLLRKLRVQSRDQGSSEIYRQYSESKCKKPCPIGPKPRNSRDPPNCYEPERLETTAFKVPPFIKPKIFRPIQRKEILGPNASKCECYKNPEYYSYHRYSIYDLKAATNAVKACIKCCE